MHIIWFYILCGFSDSELEGDKFAGGFDFALFSPLVKAVKKALK